MRATLLSNLGAALALSQAACGDITHARANVSEQ
jgi:hypothetical protein